jgi:hypothetical protein
MSMSVDDGRQVATHCTGHTVCSSTNGPPDNETLDRRRVDPPAGCRATAEPASLAGRWSGSSDNRRTTESPLAARVWGLRAAKRFLDVESGGYMTSSGMYDRHHRRMLNIELARIIHADREREIEATLRSRRLVGALRSTPAADPRTGPTAPSQELGRDADARPCPGQTPASTGALSR